MRGGASSIVKIFIVHLVRGQDTGGIGITLFAWGEVGSPNRGETALWQKLNIGSFIRPCIL